MAKTNSIYCSRRTIGKRSRRQVRQNGDIPGVIYSKGKPGSRVAFEGRPLERLFAHGSGGLYSLQVDDDPAPVLAVVRELQRDPVSRQLTHVDFLRVDADEPIESAVTVSISGEEELREKGGFLQVGAREVQIKCLPRDLPETFMLDVSLMIPGDQVLAKALLLPAGVELLSDPDLLIVSVIVEVNHEEPEYTPVEAEEEA